MLGRISLAARATSVHSQRLFRATTLGRNVVTAKRAMSAAVAATPEVRARHFSTATAQHRKIPSKVALTPASPDRVGWIWSDTALDMPSWEVEFEFHIGGARERGSGGGLALCVDAQQHQNGSQPRWFRGGPRRTCGTKSSPATSGSR